MITELVVGVLVAFAFVAFVVIYLMLVVAHYFWMQRQEEQLWHALGLFEKDIPWREEPVELRMANERSKAITETEPTR